MQERSPCGAIHVFRLAAWGEQGIASGGGVGRAPDPATIATDRIVRRIADIRIEYPELRVIKNVKSFCTEFEIATFRNLKKLKQGEIEVKAVGIDQEIAPGIPERETLRCGKGCGVVQKRTKTLRIESVYADRQRGARTADYVGIGTRPCSIRYAGIIQNRNAKRAPAINNAERCSRLKQRDARNLPAIEERAQQVGIALRWLRRLRGSWCPKPPL